MRIDLIVGIDGGGTSTRAVLADLRGRVLGVGLGGPSNFDDIGAAATQASLGEAVNAACQSAGVRAPFAAAFLGMAGVVSDLDRQTIREIAQRLNLAGAEQIGIDHDCRIALAGGLSGRPGIVLITGTGSSCYGRSASGEDWRTGGWGQLISDEGSSYWLGVQAMRAAVMAYDGRLPATLLMDEVLRALEIDQMDALMNRIYAQKLSRAEIAGLARLVITAAEAGDAHALRLIEQGANDLGDCVLAAARRLGFEAAALEIALTGGLLKAGETFQGPLRRAIGARLPGSRVLLAELPPVLGACLLALECLGIPPSAEVSTRLLETAGL